MKDRDSLQRFVFESFAVRGQIVHLDKTWQTVLGRHEYPPELQPVLGQAMAATVLLAGTLKFDGRLTLQSQGDGALKLLVAQCTHDLQVRGLARWRSEVLPGSFSAQVGQGTLSITIQTESRSRPYQGVVPLAGESINECLAGYFASSEQLPTRVWLVSAGASVAGLLLQRMPEAEQAGVDDDWHRVQLLADTMQDHELISLDNEGLLTRLFSQERIRVFDKRLVCFRCACDAGRIEEMLRALGEAELQSILAEQGRIDVGCEFCARKQQFDPVDVKRILAGATSQGGTESMH